VRSDLAERPVLEIGGPIFVEEGRTQNARREHDLEDFCKQKESARTSELTSFAGGLK
jgi:hypothetical protein